ncbi:next to BRCA1 gene 1 protein isoform X1 [Gadus morhua]|uniref:next to BRCA1 gene 1 protein isoform X1 n=1 Tax=Gadus morhua TaxID=8049 RepID=UPI0011B4A62F|nr:next to BRCA1 gene 1 protein-like isoform X1 [Gadus morhua]
MLTAAPSYSAGMGLPVTIKVNFRGNVKRLLAPDLDKSEWESVDAWIKASFGISHFQVKYFDEDNEEICINSQEEYEEAIKSAEKQGNQLHINVYKMKGQACGAPLKGEVKELKGDLRPAPPYPSRVKTVDKGTQVTPDREPVTPKDPKGSKPEDEPPPVWFRSYMEKFKDEVVKEVVERMCNDFSGQCCTHKAEDEAGGQGASGGASGGPPAVVPRAAPPSTSNTSLGYTPNCSSCNKLTSEGAYKCSVCPSCILCELCRHSHDPSHSLVRTKTPLSIPEHGTSGELRFPRRGDRTVRKAERQRLKAERRQLRAEVKEIKKKLRVEKRSLQWSGPAAPARPALPHMASASTQAPPPPPPPASEAASGSAPAGPEPPASSPEGPGLSVSSLVPTMAALFLDENLPDGTRLEPGAKFIKYWKMRNSGTIGWTSETKLKFMWGNLGLASEERRELPVPPLQPGQVGVVSVAFVAPVMDGTYTSHWRLAHCGTQFGPRVWCSIVVDPGNTGHTFCPQSNRLKEDRKEDSALDSETEMSVDLSNRDYYFPSVDLLTAQDLLSFELLDINIVQELETVPNNTPVDLTPCMSPLPRDTPVMERAAPVAEGPGADLKSCFLKPGARAEAPGPEDEREQEISGAQFLCETLIRSLTLEEAPDQKPPRRGPQAPRRPLVLRAVSRDSGLRPERTTEAAERLPGASLDPDAIRVEVLAPPPYPGRPPGRPKEESGGEGPPQTTEGELGVLTEERTDAEEKSEEDEEEEEEEERGEDEDWDEVSSQTSSCDDYIIVLPDCFDTTRPLGDSTYTPTQEDQGPPQEGPEGGQEGGQEGQEEEEEQQEEDEEDEDDEEEDEEEEEEEEEEEVTPEESVLFPPPPPSPPLARPPVLVVNPLLSASKTLKTPPLTPPLVTTPSPPPPTPAPPPQLPATAPVPVAPPTLYSPRSEALYLAEECTPPDCDPYEPRQPGITLNVSSGLSRSAGSASSAFETYNPRPGNALQPSRAQGGITEGLVKGALSVAASAYKALFTGPNCSVQRGVDPAARQDPSLMAMLLEMGFRDLQLNQRLLRKHGYSLLHTVNELVQIAEEGPPPRPALGYPAPSPGP